MSFDYKYEMQLKAEELAEEETGRCFYELQSDVQDRIFHKAMNVVCDNLVARAEMMRDSAEDR